VVRDWTRSLKRAALDSSSERVSVRKASWAMLVFVTIHLPCVRND
jgi:hypothetical protein